MRRQQPSMVTSIIVTLIVAFTGFITGMSLGGQKVKEYERKVVDLENRIQMLEDLDADLNLWSTRVEEEVEDQGLMTRALVAALAKGYNKGIHEALSVD
jgi:hypothetical protein